jgi:hypothetical protein
MSSMVSIPSSLTTVVFTRYSFSSGLTAAISPAAFPSGMYEVAFPQSRRSAAWSFRSSIWKSL